ncbi:MAG: hypothetical protein KBT29_07005 [Prevotellaceae bacterium]|nr:hypothetical protein [Candidatus Minthosoma caballi]
MATKTTTRTTTKTVTKTTTSTTTKRKTRKKKNESFSWKKALGITYIKRWFTRKTGIPLTKGGWERKIGKFFIDLFTGKKNEKKEEGAVNDGLMGTIETNNENEK